MKKSVIKKYNSTKQLDLESVASVLNDMCLLPSHYGRKKIISGYCNKISKDICLGKHPKEEIEFWIDFLVEGYLPASAVLECLRVFHKHKKLDLIRKFKSSEYKTIQAFLARVLPKKELIFLMGSESVVAQKTIKKKLES